MYTSREMLKGELTWKIHLCFYQLYMFVWSYNVQNNTFNNYIILYWLDIVLKRCKNVTSSRRNRKIMTSKCEVAVYVIMAVTRLRRENSTSAPFFSKMMVKACLPYEQGQKDCYINRSIEPKASGHQMAIVWMHFGRHQSPKHHTIEVLREYNQ